MAAPTVPERAASGPGGNPRAARRAPARTPPPAVTALAALLLTALTACGYGSQRVAGPATEPVAAGGPQLSAPQVNIGYFATVTHATALIGLAPGGAIREELGGTAVRPQLFNAGPSAIEALNAGAVDIAFLGPNPAVNGYTQSGGRNLRIVAGAASGGAALVVNPETVHGLDDLAGASIATPQLGSTQDVALLSYLGERGFTVDPVTGKGDVSVLRIAASELGHAFESGAIDGAWVPEPSAAELRARGAVTLLDEAERWPDGRYVVTQVIASQRFLADHPDVVEAVLRGVVTANAWLNAHPEEARTQVNAAIKEATGNALPEHVLGPAFDHVEFLNDPLAASLRASAENAVDIGLLPRAELDGIYGLSPLNTVLADAGLPEITDDAGLGVP
jgi:NitT/TauT family transport system substrate-binding protein